MAVRCGVDIVYTPNILNLLANEATLQKFFHPSELENPEPQHLAGIIAAKEAFFKAVGNKPKFKDIEVVYESSGRPKLVVAPQWQSYKTCDVSISHDQEYAIAMVMFEL